MDHHADPAYAWRRIRDPAMDLDDKEQGGTNMSTFRSSVLLASLSVLLAGPALADRTEDREE